MKTCPQCQNDFPDEVDFCPSDGLKLRRASSDEDPLLHRVLEGRWVVEEKIGEGGMGSVYRGHQKSVNRPIAIKTLRKSLVDSDEFVDRFFREAQIASKINHPNCVTIYDYGHTEDDVLFIVMEFLDGQPLSDLADNGDLSLVEILEIACDTTRALAAAHTFNVVHRDLKPDNVFVVDVPGGGKNAKVLDFGIAKALDAEKSMTRTGMIFGTPEYMSPEQCAGIDIDPRSDLYSLGCILYELVGGRTPFRATTPMAVLMAHVNEAAPRLEEGVVVPKSLESIIFKLLEKEPDNRFDSANDLLGALEVELQGLRGAQGGHVARSTSKDTSQVAFESTMALSQTGPQTGPQSGPQFAHADGSTDTTSSMLPKRNLAVIAVVLLVLVFGAAGLALMAFDSSTDADATEFELIEGMGAELPGDEPSIEPLDPVPNETLEFAPDKAVAEVGAKTPDEESEKAADEPTEVDDEGADVEAAAASPPSEPEPKPEPKTRRKRTVKAKPTPTKVEESEKAPAKKTKKATDKELEAELDSLFD